MGRFIVDLYASEVRLVVEVDGLYHMSRAEDDAKRDRALEKIGCRMLPLDAALVMRDLEAPVDDLQAMIS